MQSFTFFTLCAESRFRKKARIRNFFSISEKMLYADQVWEILQKSYERIGGIKGSGFESVSAMVQKIPMWKLAFRDGKLCAVILYKDKLGRKLVVVGTDGTSEGKTALGGMLIKDFERAYSEISGPLRRFFSRLYGATLDKYRIPFSQVKQILKKDWEAGNLEPLGEYKYKRRIQGTWYEKEMFGTPNLRIKPKEGNCIVGLLSLP